LFEGQQIATHDTIKDIMYALLQENGHVVWKEKWYAFTLGVSLQTNFYMTHEDQVFVIDVVVTNLTRKMMATSVMN
jgi:lipid-A-disaccharide synthase-like uncharacterized protein